MAKVDLTLPIYHDDEKAREHLESILWPNGPICPHCGNSDQTRVTKLQGTSTRPGVYKCKECRKPFSVTVNTVMHRSKIPLRKWVLAAQLMASSKKGMSALQLQRMLGITYESAWFLFHRLRECAIDPQRGPVGGQHKVIEADETYVGGKAKNAHKNKPIPKKQAVFSLVERDGEVRSFHVTNVNAATLRPILVKHASRKSYLMTDDALVYERVGREFHGHGVVNHSAGEYARGYFWTTNSIESYFAILKRGIMGSFHNVSEQHLYRYLAEFDFRFNTRHLDDGERIEELLRGAAGKRLTYHQTDNAAHA